MQRTLIVGPAWVGDMVMAQCLFKLLRQQRPDSPIDVLAPDWSRPLLERMPEVDRAIGLPFDHGDIKLGEHYRLGVSLAGQNYRRALVLPNSLKSALVPAFARIPQRTGWRGEMRYGLINDIRKLDKRRYPLMIQRFAALAYEPGADLPEDLPWPTLVVDTAQRAGLLEELTLNTQRPILALCPGAEFGPAKRWPEAHFAAVAGARIADGWQVWLLGSEQDQSVAGAILDALPEQAKGHCRNLAGATSLDQAIDLLSLADAVVSNDSGLMHIAAALDRPLVAVYGSTSPNYTPPLASRVRSESIAVDCGPCFQRHCPEGHLHCLKELLPQQVLVALDAVATQALVRVATNAKSHELIGVNE